MGHDQESGGGGSPVQTLMVAWTIVVGLAFAPVFVYAKGTENMEALIAFLGAAILIGGSLFVALALARAGSRARRKPASTAQIANISRRGGVFGRR